MKNIKKKINKFIQYLNFLIKMTLLKHLDKTNNILSSQISNFNKHLISSFFKIKKILLKYPNKIDNIFSFKISYFNKYLISSFFKMKILLKYPNKINNIFSFKISDFNKHLISSFFKIKKILLKYPNKINNIFSFKISDFNKHLISSFFKIKKILLKYPNKINNIFSFKISNFNKYLIGSISLLFLSLFYLSIPTLYDKTWVQNSIEKKILKEFKINFSISSDVTYEILPFPNFTFKNVKIFANEDENVGKLAEIKKLKVFISPKNFFNKDSFNIKKILILDANFSIKNNNLEYFKSFLNNNLLKKKIIIKSSNIFFKNKEEETVSIIKINKLTFFYDKVKILNQVFLKGKIFKVPFILEFNKNLINNNSLFVINSKKYKFQFENNSFNNKLDIKGINKITILNLLLLSEYKKEKDMFNFESKKTKLNSNNVNYKGQINFNPFDLFIDINFKEIKLKKLFNTNSILFELIKSGSLFNDNLSANININSDVILGNKLFDSLKLVINLNNGILDINDSVLINKKIGLLKLTNSKLFLLDNNLIFNGNFNLKVNNSTNFHNYLQTKKKIRKLINNINFNLDFNISTNELNLINLTIDDYEQEVQITNLLNNLNMRKVPKIKNVIELKNFIRQALNVHYSG
jgi:hypothetical protein